jgi:hypothetical protein
MEDVQETVVEEASVDVEQVETQETEETVETVAIDTPKPDNNGEAIRREVERRETKLKQQYESQMEEIRAENSYLDKQAQIYGYRDRNEYKQALDTHLAQQAMEQEAARQGIDPDIYAQHLQPLSQENEQLKQRLQGYEQTEHQKQVSQSWSDLYSAYPNLSEDAKSWGKGENPNFYTDQMQQLIGMGYQPVHAYELAHKDTLFKQKEQEVVARLTGRDGKQVLSSIDSPNTMTLNFADMSDAEIQAISARVQRGERITS